MEEARKRILQRVEVLRSLRVAQSAVLDAQADALDDRQCVDPPFRDRAPGWSLGVYPHPSLELRKQAVRQLTRIRSPLRAAVRALHQSESDHDVRFLKLLWEERPQLVAAVGLYARLERERLHPDVFRRDVWEKGRQAAALLLDSRVNYGRASDGLVKAIEIIRDSLREAEHLDTHLLQLALLGWGRWCVLEGELEPAPGPGRGGGEPMPRWILSASPAEVDGSRPDDLASWWYVEGGESGEREGKSLWTHTVSAIVEALGLAGKRNDQDLREPVAHHLPDVFSDRRDPSPGGPIKAAVDNLRR